MIPHATRRVVVELLLIGETALANYTFAARLDYRVNRAEREIAHLQEVWWAREPFRARDVARYPDVIRFAGEEPGIKYTRMLAIQGIEVITNRIDSIAAKPCKRLGRPISSRLSKPTAGESFDRC